MKNSDSKKIIEYCKWYSVKNVLEDIHCSNVNIFYTVWYIKIIKCWSNKNKKIE